MGHLSETMERMRAERIARRSFPNSVNNSNKKDSAIHSGGNEDIGKADVDRLLSELKTNEPNSDDLFFRLAILVYELGDLNRSIVYAERFKNDEKMRIAHLANGKLALADILAQLYLLCISLGWNFHELRKLGVEHLEERQQDFKRDGWCEIKR